MSTIGTMFLHTIDMVILFIKKIARQIIFEVRTRGARHHQPPNIDVEKPLLVGFRGQMPPRNLVSTHPAAIILQEYVTASC